MNELHAYLTDLQGSLRRGWNYFWFSPAHPATLCLIRVLAGSLLFYTHLVWSIDLVGFFGAEGRMSAEHARLFHGSDWSWSYLFWIESASALWFFHAIALIVLFLFAVGLFTRVAAVLAFLITVAYANRAPTALFGLDQINALLAMYLMLGPCGEMMSLDAWLAGRHQSGNVRSSVWANISIRLIQIHMCVVYFFAGSGKLLGNSWWDGTALWGALANYEYQTLDMTWLAAHPILVNIMTQLTVAFELTYPVLVWHRLTRPLVLLLAIPLHLGIAFCMGMITFGTVMLIANLAFVSPSFVQRCSRTVVPGAGEGRAVATSSEDRITSKARSK